MSKIIIENKSNLPDTDAVDLALRVMKEVVYQTSGSNIAI
jgi:hypothetical protein